MVQIGAIGKASDVEDRRVLLFVKTSLFNRQRNDGFDVALGPTSTPPNTTCRDFSDTQFHKHSPY